MTDIRGHPPPATAPAAPVARAMDALAAAVPAIVLIVVMFAAVFELLFQRQRGGSDSGRRSRPRQRRWRRDG